MSRSVYSEDDNNTRELLPAHDDGAEQSVLGSVLKHPECIAQVLDLQPVHFYVPLYRNVWAAMLEQWQHAQPIDYTLLMANARNRYTMQNLADINLGVPTAAFVRHYADIVRETAKLREIGSASSRWFDATFNPDAKSQPLLQRMRAEVERLSSDTLDDMLSPEQLSTAFIDDLEARRQGHAGTVRTGFADIDGHLLGTGMTDGQLVLLMGVTGLGKTELGLQLAFNVAQRGEAVLYVSLEMEPIELAHRIARITGDMDPTALARGIANDDDALQVANRIHDAAWRVAAPHRKYTTDDVSAHAHRMQAETGRVRLVVVDYLQRLSDSAGRTANREQDVALMAANLKSLAREMQCPVLALVQPNRDYATRSNKRPIRSDLRESGRLEIEADIILGLYREQFFQEVPTGPNVTEVILLKNRAGVGGRQGAYAQLLWHEPSPGAGRYVGYTPLMGNYADPEDDLP